MTRLRGFRPQDHDDRQRGVASIASTEIPRTSAAALAIADQLDGLAREELEEVERFIGTQSPAACAVLLIEACRCIDHIHVIQKLSLDERIKLPVQDFDIIVRGWNILFGLLANKMGGFTGFPLKESDPELRNAVVGIMHFCGRYVLLNRTAEMVRHGMVTASAEGNNIDLELSNRTVSDHFHDQIDLGRLVDLRAKIIDGFRSENGQLDTMKDLRSVIGTLTFPWQTPQGLMVGYTADPDVDAYFLRAVTQDTLQWRDDAGIHPDAKIGGCSGEALVAVIHVLMSFYMKHIIFVEEAIKIHPGINQHMSLTIWKTRPNLIQSLLLATSLHENEINAALDLIIVGAGDAEYFMKEQAPGIPLIIELSNEYLLTPVSGVFRNPFNGVRMVREFASPAIRNAFREHREEWMAMDLYALFEGNRFQRVSGQTKLRRKGKTVTDIDAAVYDGATGDLLLFQLKWQDFTSSNVKSQRSKAKNFTEQVREWAEAISGWLDDFGTAALCQALKIKLRAGTVPRSVRLIALGRSNARFRSYGYESGVDVLTLPWAQFVRLRYAIGPQQELFELLGQAVIREASSPVSRQPLPYLLDRKGMTVNFKDIWSEFLDESF